MSRQTPRSVDEYVLKDEGTVDPPGLENGQASADTAASFSFRRHGPVTRAAAGTREYLGALLALVLITVVLAVTQDGFMTLPNMQNVLLTNAPLFLVSVGMTFVIISAGFDLSVGAMMAFSQMVLMLLINNVGLNPVLAIVIAVVCCGVIGGFTNGITVGVLKINFFVATLATMTILQGVVLVATNGITETIDSSWLTSLGNNAIGPVPIPVLVCGGTLVAAWVVLRLTSFGRAVYCVGGNQEAARMSGISVSGTVIAVYALSGVCAGLAGVVDAARLSAATPIAGSTVALTSATAVLLGGASLTGGVGKLAGMAIGVLVLAFLVNGVNLIGVNPYWQGVVTGAVLLIAVLLDRVHHAGLLGRRART